MELIMQSINIEEAIITEWPSYRSDSLLKHVSEPTELSALGNCKTTNKSLVTYNHSDSLHIDYVEI